MEIEMTKYIAGRFKMNNLLVPVPSVSLGLDFDWNWIQIEFKLTFLIQIRCRKCHRRNKIDYIMSGFNGKV